MSGYFGNDWKIRRCRYFDNDGNERDGGCPRISTTCKFVHPEDPEWSELRPTKYKFKAKRRDYSPENRGSSWRDRSPSGSRPHRARPRSRSVESWLSDEYRELGRRPPRFTRRPSIEEEKPTHTELKKILEEHRIEMVARLEAELKMDERRLLPPPQEPRALRASSTAAPMPAASAATSSSFSVTPTTPSSLPAPPSASAPTLPPPLPPPPAEPQFTNADVLPEEDGSVDEKEEWMRRIGILADSVQIELQIDKVEEDISTAKEFLSADYYTSLEPTDPTIISLQDQITELEAEKEELQKKLDAAIEKLINSDSWPVMPDPTQVELEDDVHEKRRDMVKYVQELQEAAGEMSRLLSEIGEVERPPPTMIMEEGELTLSPTEAQHFPLMDIDSESAPPPSAAILPLPKRKRFSIAESDPKGKAEETSIPPITQVEVDEIRDKVRRLENEISTLNNTLNEREQVVRETMEGLIDSRFEGLDQIGITTWNEEDRDGDQEMDDGKDGEEREDGEDLDEVTSKFAALERNVNVMDNEVMEIAGELADLMKKSSDLESSLVLARAQNLGWADRFAKLEARLQRYTSEREAANHTITVLQNAMNAYNSRPPSPPPSPSSTPLYPDATYVIDALAEPLLNTIRTESTTMLENHRRLMEEMLKEKGGELYRTLWEKLALTMQVVKGIEARLSAESIRASLVPASAQGMPAAATWVATGGMPMGFVPRAPGPVPGMMAVTPDTPTVPPILQGGPVGTLGAQPTAWTPSRTASR